MQNAAQESADAAANELDILQRPNRRSGRSAEMSDVRWCDGAAER
jgi:hypothetical protein